MLSNAYYNILVNIGFDTAENEPAKICKTLQKKSSQYSSIQHLLGRWVEREGYHGVRRQQVPAGIAEYS